MNNPGKSKGNVVQLPNRPPSSEAWKPNISLKTGGGGGTYDGMEARISKLEGQLESLDKRFDTLDRRLDRIEDKIPTKWDMAQVIFYVTGTLMAAAIFGPRLVAMVSGAS